MSQPESVDYRSVLTGWWLVQ